MVPRSFALALSLLCAPAVACGGSSKPYYIPASSPVKPFEPPEREDLLADDDLDDWSEAVDGEDDGGDTEPVEDDDTAGGTAEAGAGGAGIERRAPVVAPGEATVKGGLDKDVIRRVVRQQTAHFQACYESELRKDPELAGTVRIEFVIDAAGAVTSASADGMAEPVAACVTTVIRRIQFPKPKGGGTVKVTYPVRFQVQG
jgi:hypothetical protein